MRRFVITAMILSGSLLAFSTVETYAQPAPLPGGIPAAGADARAGKGRNTVSVESIPKIIQGHWILMTQVVSGEVIEIKKPLQAHVKLEEDKLTLHIARNENGEPDPDPLSVVLRYQIGEIKSQDPTRFHGNFDVNLAGLETQGTLLYWPDQDEDRIERLRLTIGEPFDARQSPSTRDQEVQGMRLYLARNPAVSEIFAELDWLRKAQAIAQDAAGLLELHQELHKLQEQAMEPGTDMQALTQRLAQLKEQSSRFQEIVDVDNIRGRWKLVHYEVDGTRNPSEEGRVDEYRVETRVLRGTFDDGSPHVRYENFKLDSTQNPKHMDITLEATDLSVKAIYALEGDRLTICNGRDGVRPTRFSSTEGGGQVLIIYERAKD